MKPSTRHGLASCLCSGNQNSNRNPLASDTTRGGRLGQHLISSLSRWASISTGDVLMHQPHLTSISRQNKVPIPLVFPFVFPGFPRQDRIRPIGYSSCAICAQIFGGTRLSD
jgi:hypothetical protein